MATDRLLFHCLFAFFPIVFFAYAQPILINQSNLNSDTVALVAIKTVLCSKFRPKSDLSTIPNVQKRSLTKIWPGSIPARSFVFAE